MKIRNFTTQELDQYWNEEQVIFVTYRSVWQLHRSQNAGYSFTKMRTLDKPYTQRGRFHAIAVRHLPAGLA